MCLLNLVFSETAIPNQRFHDHDPLLAECYSVPHEEKEIMLGMYDVTSIATTKQNGRPKPALLQSEVALVAVYASRDAR